MTSGIMTSTDSNQSNNSKQTSASEMSLHALLTLWPSRKKDAHKGDFGHVLIIGGNYGMGGSVKIAAEAALRIGAGRVTVLTRPEHVALVVSTRPEIMCRGVSKVEEVESFFSRANVLVIGPGLGDDEWAQALMRESLLYKGPKVIDADGLKWLSAHEHREDQWVLTPHPGEAGALLHCDAQEIQADRVEAVEVLSAMYGGCVVLKGSGTLVKESGEDVCLCPHGNPGMASAGMGDCLSGLIAGLMAQGLSRVLSAKLGVMLHAKAADLAVLEKGEVGLLALDILPFLSRLV